MQFYYSLNTYNMLNKQFELTRNNLLGFLNRLDESKLDVQPEGFNNTIRWHIGHVLVVGEKFMFDYPNTDTGLNPEYITLFAPGTKPADWTVTPPTLAELKEALTIQTARINEIEADFFQKEQPYTFGFGKLDTYHELFALMMFHEANHLGQMQAMNKITAK